MNQGTLGIGQMPKTKSVFINQLDGGYTLNMQGENFYPVKVCVTVDEVTKAITDFFNTPETLAQMPPLVTDATALPEIMS